MTVSRRGKRGTIKMRPASRNRRVSVNAYLANTSKAFDARPINNGGKAVRGSIASPGEKIGRLVVIRYVGNRKNTFGPAIAMYEFMCDCGELFEAPLFQIKNGIRRSCGCGFTSDAVRPSPEMIDPFTARHGRYIEQPCEEDGEYAPGAVNLAHTIIDLWIDDGIFLGSEIRSIEIARELWRSVARPSHDYFDSDDPENEREGLNMERAKALLRRCKNHVGCSRWLIFENVVRWNEPYGTPGSRLWEPSPECMVATQEIVAGVAREIYRGEIL